MTNQLRHSLTKTLPATLCLMTGALLHAENAPTSSTPTEMDPLVKASAYANKSVWSYHDSKPVPWAKFRPKDFGSTPVVFNAEGVRSVGRVPAPGVHPRMFFGPEDLPVIRKRIKEDAAGKAAWLNLQAWCHAFRNDYDEKADYAQPDWANGGFHVHGRFVDFMRIGGYGKNREDYFSVLANGDLPKYYSPDEKDKTKPIPSPAGFFKPAACEALRCLIEDDAQGAKKLAKAVVTAIKFEQERRAKVDKPVEAGQPPRPSTGRTDACGLGYIYDFIFNYMTAEQKRIVHDELVTISAWADNYGTFNNAEASRSNWATFSYWVFDLMSIEGEPGFNDLKFLGLYRGWRNFFTYSFFDSGAAYEAEGKLLFGLDAVVTFDRVCWKYGLEPLSQHPLPRSYYGKFSANAMLPTRDKFAVFDILGSVSGGFTTPHDLVVAKYLFPQDKTTDFVYRAMVGDDYRELPHGLHSLAHQAISSAIFATAYEPTNTPDKLNLPLSFFCGQRALMMARSSWDTNATLLTMHVRGASGGHPYPDRGGLMLAAQGLPWVTIPGKDQGSWACSTVGIDGAAQNASTPGRVVEYVDTPDTTFTTADLSYCWNWVWSSAGRTKGKDGHEITKADVEAGNVDTRNAWTTLDQTFNDFAFTKTAAPLYNKPLKFTPHWLALDGVLSPVMRQPNTPVLKCFRTAGVVRGKHPYVLVVDDVQRDALPTRYDWNLTLMNDPDRSKVVVVRADAAKVSAQPDDIVLVNKVTLGPDGAPKAGDPALLVRVLEAKGNRLPDVVGMREKVNLLTVATLAASPDFKVLIYAFRVGDALPKTTWDSAHRAVTIAFPDQEDVITCAPAASGRTDLTIRRAGKVIATVAKPLASFVDPASDALTERMRKVGPRVEALRTKGFDPAKLPGFVAGWKLDALNQTSLAPMAGSDPAAQPCPVVEGAAIIEDSDGRKALAIGKDFQPVAIDAKMIAPGAITVAAWVKTKPGPFMGRLFDVPGVTSFNFVQGGLWFNVPGAGSLGSWSSAMLSSWTHLCVTWDGTIITGYRNGIALTTDSSPRKIKLEKVIRLGGADAYGNADVQARDLLIYREALSAQTVEDLYLWGRYGSGNSAR